MIYQPQHDDNNGGAVEVQIGIPTSSTIQPQTFYEGTRIPMQQQQQPQTFYERDEDQINSNYNQKSSLICSVITTILAIAIIIFINS